MPKMGVDPTQLEAPQPVPGGWYKLRLKGITIKKSSSGKGFNYEAYLNTVEQPTETNDKFVLFRMNNGFSQGQAAQDMHHALGFPMEVDGGFAGGDAAWKLKDDKNPDEIDGAQYTGVLLGKTGEAELAIDNYNGVEKNIVKQWKCKVDQCATRFPKVKHATDLIGKKK